LLLVCVLPLQHAHETAGAAGIRHSPRPLWGRKTNANLGRIVPRDREVAFAEAAFAIGTVIASEATLNSASSFRGDAKHRTRNLATTRRARRIRSVAFKADGRRSTLSRNTSGAWRCRFLLSWATRMTRASNRACFSSRTFRLRGWRCFRRPATFSISRSRGFSTKRWSASWRWRKRIAGRRAILPRSVLEDGATASVRRAGSIRAVQGRLAMTSLLDALPSVRPINHGYLGVRRAARRGCFPHPGWPKFQKRPYFSVDGAHGQGAK
jgi:hypothetical protein